MFYHSTTIRSTISNFNKVSNDYLEYRNTNFSVHSNMECNYISTYSYFFSNIPNFQINEEDASATTSNRNITINRRPFTGTFTEDKIMNNHPRGAQLTRLPSRPRIRLRRTQTAHNLDASIKKSFEVSNKRPPENNLNMVTASDTRRNRVTSVSDTKSSPNASSKESPSRASLSYGMNVKNVLWLFINQSCIYIYNGMHEHLIKNSTYIRTDF